MSEFKDIFGKPFEGIHSYRFGGIAIIDTLLTIVLTFLISIVAGFSFFKTLLVLFLSGEFMHYLFGVNTAVMIKIKKLFT
jgi:hypothetical protein